MNEQSLQETDALRKLVTQARETSKKVTTSAERSRLNFIVKRSHQQVLDLYGKYIKKPLTDNTVASKFILLDQDSFDTINPIHHEIRKITLPENYDPYAEMIPVGRQRFFTLYWPDIWPQLQEENRIRLVDQHKSIDDAQKYSADAICYMIATHEIAHLYMDNSLPLWLAETGAYYYGKKSVEELGIKAHSPCWEPYEKIYASLEEKYGENLHHTYFGTLQAQLPRIMIYLQPLINESVKELFPESDNLRN